MASAEEIEKIRQGIMRFRELLDIMQQRLEDGERTYAQFFAACSPDDREHLKTKDLQWKAAETMVNDPSPLSKAALIQFGYARELERAFEELHDNVASY